MMRMAVDSEQLFILALFRLHLEMAIYYASGD
jgi:hypothetical protein